MEEIKKVVSEFILKEFLPGEDPENLTDTTPLISAGILDSLATLKLVMFLEEHFGIRIEAHEATDEHLNTLDEIAALVESKRD